MNGKVAPEVAQQEFERFAEAMDLDLDPKGMDAEDRKSFETAKRRFLTAVEDGRLVVNDTGEPVYTPQKGDTSPITFFEPTGGTMMAMDLKKAGHDVTKGLAAMADMTKQDIKRYHNMSNRDLRVCQAISVLFLG